MAKLLPVPLYIDQDLLVIDKPSGIALLADRTSDTHLLPALKAEFGPCSLVHRLDKGTSGTLLVARNRATHARLTRMFAKRELAKYYVAQVCGGFPQHATYDVQLPLRKGRKSRYRIAAPRAQIKLQDRCYTVPDDGSGVYARTFARRVSSGPNNTSWLVLKPLTGRTHQIRVHLAWLGYPIVGDHLYNQATDKHPVQRMMLHCHKLVVPGYGVFVSPLPETWL